eukprot:CAMPEP_0194765604 /NCGR_PEP_ID=MMETSP0323_2-20130528/26966_1 /TAXON_ID=2866 ORGANISM="Crypthecodinium cohnii, Strain Seligo" /NCGR_SAMPLE_ID=MMETSP0323_2 /ASSEMBLY_ACC=CAM_ASM_000346 /LENGTH=72 /DNA_ID=CAMNT_0039695435 /DNA_START=13 /DNA_END=231 /DNA_ORIENTATION=-
MKIQPDPPQACSSLPMRPAPACLLLDSYVSVPPPAPGSEVESPEHEHEHERVDDTFSFCSSGYTLPSIDVRF